jgi:hypothetical protein
MWGTPSEVRAQSLRGGSLGEQWEWSLKQHNLKGLAELAEWKVFFFTRLSQVARYGEKEGSVQERQKYVDGSRGPR